MDVKTAGIFTQAKIVMVMGFWTISVKMEMMEDCGWFFPQRGAQIHGKAIVKNLNVQLHLV